MWPLPSVVAASTAVPAAAVRPTVAAGLTAVASGLVMPPPDWLPTVIVARAPLEALYAHSFWRLANVSPVRWCRFVVVS